MVEAPHRLDRPFDYLVRAARGNQLFQGLEGAVEVAHIMRMEQGPGHHRFPVKVLGRGKLVPPVPDRLDPGVEVEELAADRDVGAVGVALAVRKGLPDQGDESRQPLVVAV